MDAIRKCLAGAASFGILIVVLVAPRIHAQDIDLVLVATIQDAAERGDPLAQIVIGMNYAMGLGVPQDVGSAITWWRRAGEADVPRPPVEQRVDWSGFTPDSSLVRWARQGAEQGASASQAAMLGTLYLYGWGGVPQDGAEALAWFRRAAESGHTDAYLFLGVVHVAGRGVARDDVAAYKWLSLAAARHAEECDSSKNFALDCGDDDLRRWQRFRAQLYEELAAGLDAAQLAAVQQSVAAQRGAAARRRMQNLAERGDSAAQREVGRLFLAGKHVPHDVVAAHMWLSLAAARGDEDARRLRDRVAAGMDSAQLDAARRLARDWRPTRRR